MRGLSADEQRLSAPMISLRALRSHQSDQPLDRLRGTNHFDPQGLRIRGDAVVNHQPERLGSQRQRDDGNHSGGDRAGPVRIEPGILQRIGLGIG